MTLNFQNKIVFPAPETSYTTQTAMGQVLYVPRDIMQQVRKHKVPSASLPKKKSIVKEEEEETMDFAEESKMEVKKEESTEIENEDANVFD